MPIPPRRRTGYTRVSQDPRLRFAAELARAVHFHRLYPPKHSYVINSTATVHSAYEVALEKESPFTIGTLEGEFFIGGERVHDVPSVVTDLVSIFMRLDLQSVTFHHGMTQEEMKKFVVKFGELDTAAMKAATEEGALDALSAECPNISLDIYSYEKVLTTEGDLFRKVKDVATQTGEDGAELLDRLLEEGGEGEMGGASGRMLSDAVVGNPGTVASLMAKGLEETLAETGEEQDEVISSGGILKVDPSGKKFKKLYKLQQHMVGMFSKISSAMALHRKAGMKEVTKTLRGIVSFLPPSSQELLFGKKFESEEEIDLHDVFTALAPKRRAELMFYDILSGQGSSEELRQELSTVAKRGSELADVVDAISQRAKELGSQEAVDKIISRLAGALQSGIRARDLIKGVIVSVDTDLEETQEYRTRLAQEGFQVIAFTNGTEALENMRRNPPDLLITEIKVPGTSGIDIMRALRRVPKLVPVIVVTGYQTFKDDFEIATYPKSTFMTKPADVDALTKKVHEFIPEPSPEEIEASMGLEDKVLVDSDELESAKEVQESLLPDELPSVEALDLAVHYSPCKEVGGDYYDALPNEDGTWTFIVADVSGKGLPAAMVMVLVRSLVHLTFPSHGSPRESVLELNRLLSKEMKQGLFVSAVCVRVDPKSRTAKFCSAGHCPSVIWLPGRGKLEVSLLQHTGIVMGLGDTTYFREGTKEQILQLEPGAGFMIYTDGVIEAMNPQRKEFGSERLTRVISHGAHMNPREINRALRAALDAFSQGKANEHDDITILTVKCTQEQGSSERKQE